MINPINRRAYLSKSAVCIIILRTNIAAANPYLYDSLSASDLEDLTLPVLSVAKLDVDNFGVSEPQKNRHGDRV